MEQLFLNELARCCISEIGEFCGGTVRKIDYKNGDENVDQKGRSSLIPTIIVQLRDYHNIVAI